MNGDDEKTQQAVALNYDGTNAPKVTATGKDEIAEQILAIARDSDVPIFENPELLRLLATLDLGEEIPEMLYLCIAQIIAFAYRIQGKAPEGWEENKQHP